VAPGDCPKCGGSGFIAKPVELNGKTEGIAFIRTKCPACGGTGRKRPISPKTAGWPHGPRVLAKRTIPGLHTSRPTSGGPGAARWIL